MHTVTARCCHTHTCRCSTCAVNSIASRTHQNVCSARNQSSLHPRQQQRPKNRQAPHASTVCIKHDVLFVPATACLCAMHGLRNCRCDALRKATLCIAMHHFMRVIDCTCICSTCNIKNSVPVTAHKLIQHTYLSAAHCCALSAGLSSTKCTSREDAKVRNTAGRYHGMAFNGGSLMLRRRG